MQSGSLSHTIELDLASQAMALAELRQRLESLYLEPRVQVKLVMRGDQVQLIEKCFDEIIAKHGILSSSFVYHFHSWNKHQGTPRVGVRIYANERICRLYCINLDLINGYSHAVVRQIVEDSMEKSWPYGISKVHSCSIINLSLQCCRVCGWVIFIVFIFWIGFTWGTAEMILWRMSYSRDFCRCWSEWDHSKGFRGRWGDIFRGHSLESTLIFHRGDLESLAADNQASAQIFSLCFHSGLQVLLR